MIKKQQIMKRNIFMVLTFSFFYHFRTLYLMASCSEPVKEEKSDEIKVYTSNTWYLQFKQKPVLLLGASDYHNIFQRDDIVDEFELLQ